MDEGGISERFIRLFRGRLLRSDPGTSGRYGDMSREPSFIDYETIVAELQETPNIDESLASFNTEE